MLLGLTAARCARAWQVTQRYLRNISEYPFILGHLPPATRRRTLKPLKVGGADDLQVRLSMEVVDGEVVTQTVAVSQVEEQAKIAAEAAEAKARAEAEKAAAAAAEAAAAKAAEAPHTPDRPPTAHRSPRALPAS